MPRSPTDQLPGAPEPWVSSSVPPFRSRPPYLMTEMIAAEPALAQRLISRLRGNDAVSTLADAVRAAADRGEPIIVTGCGTSEHAAIAVAELLTEALSAKPGREVRAVQALEVAARAPTDGVVIGISHEGGTTVTNAALEAARQAGATTALITVSAGSPGAALADHIVATDEQDQSWAHTVGYLSPIIAGMVVASKVSGSRLDAVAVHALLDVAHEPRAAADVAAGLTGVDRIIVAGAGSDRAAVRELALKITEAARLPAEAMDLETVLHGPLAAAGRWTGLIVVAGAETGGRIGADRLRRALEAARALAMPAAGLLGEDVAADTDAEFTPAGRIVLPHTGRVRGVAASLLAPIIPLQLVAERLARARGVDPDTLGREHEDQAAAHA